MLAHLVARLIETGRLEHPEPVGSRRVAARNARWRLSRWPTRRTRGRTGCAASSSFSTTSWRRNCAGPGWTLHSPGWLRVLFAYAASRPGDDVRPLCLGWLSGQALEPGEAARLGLRAGEVTPADTARPDQRALLAAAARFLPVGGVLPAVRLLLRPDGGLRPFARRWRGRSARSSRSFTCWPPTR